VAELLTISTSISIQHSVKRTSIQKWPSVYNINHLGWFLAHLHKLCAVNATIFTTITKLPIRKTSILTNWSNIYKYKQPQMHYVLSYYFSRKFTTMEIPNCSTGNHIYYTFVTPMTLYYMFADCDQYTLKLLLNPIQVSVTNALLWLWLKTFTWRESNFSGHQVVGKHVWMKLDAAVCLEYTLLNNKTKYQQLPINETNVHYQMPK